MFFVSFTLIVLLLLIMCKKRRQQMSIFKHLGIPGPKPNFIFGNLIEIAKEGPQGAFPKWTKEYGPIVGFYFGGRPQVLTTDFELIRHVMIKDFHLFSERNQIIPGGIHPQPIMQKTVLWGRDNVWRQLRSAMSPSFSISKLKAMEPLMMSSIENMVNELDTKVKQGQEFNLKLIGEEVAFSIATKCIMGHNLSLYRMTPETQIIEKIAHPQFDKSLLALAMMLFPSLTFIAHPLRVWWETIRFKMLWSPVGGGFDAMKRSVRVRKAAENKPNDLLQLLLDCKQSEPTTENDLGMLSDDTLRYDTGVPEEMVISNVIVMLAAAFETSALTLQFLIHNLVNNQNVQENLRSELKEAIAFNNGEFNLKTISKVPLLNHVIKETLRMFPPGTLGTTRVSENDYEYQGYRIPRGTGVFVDVFSIHNDPELWPEPEKFQPQRFEKEFNKLAYLPFGIGPRNCIGMQFANMELQLTLAYLILKFKFEPGPSTEKNLELLKTSVTLTPKNGVFCKVSRV